ncbi:MAG: hypothetical protein HXS54_06180 [Theionarchaea archaeon]|nr:hypothetical protein [Theionarchaea archaeon]DBA34846.1 TPA_asm: hypothetical protein vir521_00052 [Caudoviricetes sp. vir521]
MIITWRCLCGRRMVVNYYEKVDGWRCKKCHSDYVPDDKTKNLYLVNNLKNPEPRIICQMEYKPGNVIHKLQYYIRSFFVKPIPTEKLI